MCAPLIVDFCHDYGVVPKGLLTLLGSLYKEFANTNRQKKNLPSKNTVS